MRSVLFQGADVWVVSKYSYAVSLGNLRKAEEEERKRLGR